MPAFTPFDARTRKAGTCAATSCVDGKVKPTVVATIVAAIERNFTGRRYHPTAKPI